MRSDNYDIKSKTSVQKDPKAPSLRNENKAVSLSQETVREPVGQVRVWTH